MKNPFAYYFVSVDQQSNNNKVDLAWFDIICKLLR